jgi:hypothetical protein
MERSAGFASALYSRAVRICSLDEPAGLRVATGSRGLVTGNCASFIPTSQLHRVPECSLIGRHAGKTGCNLNVIDDIQPGALAQDGLRAARTTLPVLATV